MFTILIVLSTLLGETRASDATGNVEAPLQVEVEQLSGTRMVEWPKEPFGATIDPSYGSLRVPVTGTFTSSGNSYLLNYRPLTVKAPGNKIEFVHLIDREITHFSLSMVRPDGSVEQATYRLKVIHWPTANQKLESKSTPWGISFGLGPSLLHYGQTNSPYTSLNRTALTVKVGTEYRFRETPWVLGASTFINALSFTPATPTNPLYRFMGVNLRGGRTLGTLSEPWQLSVFVGWYYLTMMTDGTFGFSNVMGPQVYPVIKRKFADGGNGIGYAKFSPITRQLGFFSLSSYELATGVTYLFPRRSRLQWGVGLDLSMLRLTTTDTTNLTTQVSTRSLSLSCTVSY